MALPGGGIFVVQGEMSTVITSMRRGARWSSHSYQDDNLDGLLKNFQQLKEQLLSVEDLKQIEPNVFLGPFLEVVRSDETTGPVTSLALSALNKFLSYGLIGVEDPAKVPQTVHNIADAVTHAKFVGTDQSSDGVVLMKIIQVLRSLTLSPEGTFLTNESLCEIMLSCFRICFETRLNELLRRTAEHYLKDMVLLVFKRLPQFNEDQKTTKQLKMKHGALDNTRTKRKKSFKSKILQNQEEDTPVSTPPQNNSTEKTLSTTPLTSSGNIVDMQGSISQNNQSGDSCEKPDNEDSLVEEPEAENESFVNERGIRFTPQTPEELSFVPYGLACVRELLRFLISLCNPLDKQNTDVMIHLGLNLLTVAFEVGADNIGKFSTLLALVKDDLCRHLFSLLPTERLSVFAANLQVSFLLFESLRTHLKFQLEFYLTKLMDIIISDSVKISYEQKEIALDNVLQLWRIPGFVNELYWNFDCDLYCTNLFEDLTKLLAKIAFSATTGVYHTHLLSLDALLTVIQGIEQHCYNETVPRKSRCKVSENLPAKEDLLQKKTIKKWLPAGAEHFNHKPRKGIQFLQEHGVLKQEPDDQELALFLRENPALDKKMIGEFISNRKNLHILDAYVKTFDFSEQRIDEALRSYLEAFRLPGEAPTISLLLEHFAEHWHKSNGEPFVDVDSAFTLAYAVIMLNVDQHNVNAKKQKSPMSLQGFKKNLKGVNGGGDFDESMLDEIYNTIKNDEIVMPAEHDGLVKENYLWKVLLKKGLSKDGLYFHVSNSTFDFELFQLSYGPIIAALSFVFEKTEDSIVMQKVLEGFKVCASISHHFAMSDKLDMLIKSLNKFIVLNQKMVHFGGNLKAQLALKNLINLISLHGDSVRDGWNNLFNLFLNLYQTSLLPKSIVEAEDFIETSGKILLVYEENENIQKQESGLFSSLYSYMVSTENLITKAPSIEEQQLIDLAKKSIEECNLEQLVKDFKFLHEDSLIEMVQVLCGLAQAPDLQKSLNFNYNENVVVFYLELLIKIVIQNRDRVMVIWSKVRDHIYTLLMNSSLFEYQFLLERSVIGLVRIAIRLMRNEDMSPIVLQSLRMLLLLKSSILSRISRQISFGLYELLKTSAQNIHTCNDWTIVFALLECVGAGAHPPKPIMEQDQGTKSDGEVPQEENATLDKERGYTSDSELLGKSPKHCNNGGWILVGSEGEIVGRTVHPTQYNISLERNLGLHDPSSLIKCCESLAFLVRDVAHITPYNFDVCVHCIRTFVEASLHGTKYKRSKRRSKAESPEESEEDLPSGYHQISIQLLDLMHTLHTRTAQIFKWWAEEGGVLEQEASLWTQGWCPLLQGIARLCCDSRKQVRMSAITYLQRALLVHDLQTLSGPEWEACFHRVLFPLLSQLLQPLSTGKMHISMEETRMRTATVLSKVFLHHLTPLLSLETFHNLWMYILDFMDKYMHADKSDLLNEAIPEMLKNMLLVMDSAKVFEGVDGQRNLLWTSTWERLGKFLPNLKGELFKEQDQQVVVEGPRIQHNIENATRSIILQPPTTPAVSTQLFAHLGQMVSTPIVPAGPLLQPTLQPGIPFMPDYFHQNNAGHAHSFPVLCQTTPLVPGVTTSEVQPPVNSLYSEYLGNPYNNDASLDQQVQDLNTTQLFQSQQYFSPTISQENLNTSNFFNTIPESKTTDV